MHWDVNNLYERMMSQNSPVDGFEWRNVKFRFHEKFIQEYDEDIDKGYILEVDVKYPKELHILHSNLPFLPKRMKICRCEKLVCNLYDIKTYCI